MLISKKVLAVLLCMYLLYRWWGAKILRVTLEYRKIVRFPIGSGTGRFIILHFI